FHCAKDRPQASGSRAIPGRFARTPVASGSRGLLQGQGPGFPTLLTGNPHCMGMAAETTALESRRPERGGAAPGGRLDVHPPPD
ncbi:hypothetical protein LH612_32025, partial [Klebsiella pneumoniae]|nr:hypothetical protein [Klebsiella pneumoniae]